MVEPVSRYLFKIYCQLWVTFGEKEFHNEEAEEVIGRGKKYSTQALHYLRKSGWLKSKGASRIDRRRHINKLVNPIDIINKIGKN